MFHPPSVKMDTPTTGLNDHLVRLSSIIGAGFNIDNGPREPLCRPALCQAVVTQNTWKRTVDVVDSTPVVNMTVQRRQTIPTDSLRRKTLIGGSAITCDIAKELRQVVYGSSIRWFSREWRRASFSFQPTGGDFPYGLHAQKSGSRGVVMCVQAHILMYLFEKYRGGTDILGCSALEPSGTERKMALIHALCRILWRAGQELGRCVVCVPQGTEYFEGTPQYRPDGLTEQNLYPSPVYSLPLLCSVEPLPFPQRLAPTSVFRGASTLPPYTRSHFCLPYNLYPYPVYSLPLLCSVEPLPFPVYSLPLLSSVEPLPFPRILAPTSVFRGTSTIPPYTRSHFCLPWNLYPYSYIRSRFCVPWNLYPSPLYSLPLLSSVEPLPLPRILAPTSVFRGTSTLPRILAPTSVFRGTSTLPRILAPTSVFRGTSTLPRILAPTSVFRRTSTLLRILAPTSVFHGTSIFPPYTRSHFCLPYNIYPSPVYSLPLLSSMEPLPFPRVLAPTSVFRGTSTLPPYTRSHFCLPWKLYPSPVYSLPFLSSVEPLPFPRIIAPTSVFRGTSTIPRILALTSIFRRTSTLPRILAPASVFHGSSTLPPYTRSHFCLPWNLYPSPVYSLPLLSSVEPLLPNAHHR
ncbi:hypothetical protein LSAT2_021554 [Lamellibrachia satsuma]|nr:hypothetical protein LSAT2_021554 [Lamellibrachia satsuma]